VINEICKYKIIIKTSELQFWGLTPLSYSRLPNRLLNTNLTYKRKKSSNYKNYQQHFQLDQLLIYGIDITH
jgi:hypothetical protein